MLDREEKEVAMARQPKAPLPEHKGERRCQEALDQDRKYQQMVIGAFVAAFFAASGFGRLASSVGPIAGIMLCLAGTGWTVRTIEFRFQRVTNLPVPIFMLLTFAVLGSVSSGIQGLLMIGLASVVSGLLYMSSVSHAFKVASMTLSTILFVAWFAVLPVSTNGNSEAVSAIIVALIVIVIAFASNWFGKTESQAALFLSTIGVGGWIFFLTRDSLVGISASFVTIVALTIAIVLERLMSNRLTFAPIVIAVIAVHLSTSLLTHPIQLEPIPIQITLVFLEFGLLAMAGHRFAAASLARFPISTYRATPQCVVPCQDHIWEHSVKIDAF